MEATRGGCGHGQVCGRSWSCSLASWVGERAPTTWEPRGECEAVSWGSAGRSHCLRRSPLPSSLEPAAHTDFL